MLIAAQVKRDIAKIAEHGKSVMNSPPGKWIGFDDADIKWFLDRYKRKTGKGIDWLRREYQEMLDYYAAEKGGEDTFRTLFFFPMDKRRASQILEDIE